MLKQRIDFFLSPGGLRAASYFFLKALTRIEVFKIFARTSKSHNLSTLPPHWCYQAVHTTTALSRLPSGLKEQLSSQCGKSPETIILQRGSLHMLLAGDSLVAQVTAARGPTCQIDSPPLQLAIPVNDAFLSYLYTWPAFRRKDAARHLLEATVNDLKIQDTHRLLAHIRTTNVPSLGAFKNAGWRSCALLFCNSGGRVLFLLREGIEGLTIRQE